jgi:CBS domain-containing protein
MLVKQIMTKKVISVEPKTKVTDVAQLLTKHRIHGVPVVEGGKIMGIITETDFFIKDKELTNLYLPSYIDFLKKAKFAHKVSLGKKSKINKLLKAKAEDIMTADCFTVSPTLDAKELLKIIIAKKYFTIPVVNKEGKLTGIVTQSDIINLIKL